jgi:hypothetical protein
MTLILVIETEHAMIQVSDRRLTAVYGDGHTEVDLIT